MIILNRKNFKRGVSLWVDRFKFKIISIVACYFLSLHIPWPIFEYLYYAANLVKIAAFYPLLQLLLSDAQPSAADTAKFFNYLTLADQYCYITFLTTLFYHFTTMWNMISYLIAELVMDFTLRIILISKEHQQ